MQPRPAPEGPARDNLITGPRAGTTRSEPSAPASAGASRRHHEPCARPASTGPAQPPSESRGESPGPGKSTTALGKPTGARSARTERGGAHHAGPAGTPERGAAGNNQGTRRGAKKQRPPDAADPDSSHDTQQTTAEEQVLGNTSHRPDSHVCTRQQNQPPPATEQPPSGWRSVRLDGSERLRATERHHPDGQVRAPQRQPAHTAQHTKRTPGNRSQVAENTGHPTEQGKRAHRWTRAKSPCSHRTHHTTHECTHW